MSTDTTLPTAASPTRLAAEYHVRAFLDMLNGSGGPALETLSPVEARAVLARAQSSVKVPMPPADVSTKTIETDGHSIKLVIVRPKDVTETLPAFMFFHGGGWVLGDFPTHERMIRDLVAESGAVAVCVEYTSSPEAQYPVAIEQAYAATKWVASNGSEINVDGARLAVVGNSVGGNMAAVVALRAALEHGPNIRLQVLFWPVTDANFDTHSYNQFENGHFLTLSMMKWFWDNYTTDSTKRREIYASPLRATVEQLKKLPPALIQTAELDVLRDEGEAYARKLNEAEVEVIAIRGNGLIHDYGLLNPLAQVPIVQALLRQAGAEIRRRLK